MNDEQVTIDGLRGAYQRGSLVLFIGAGVSVGCGLPDWNELAKRVAGMAFTPRVEQRPLTELFDIEQADH